MDLLIHKHKVPEGRIENRSLRDYIESVSLLNLFMHRVAAKSRIVFHLLEPLRVRLEILFGSVTGRRFALFTSFGAFKRNDTNFAFFLCH